MNHEYLPKTLMDALQYRENNDCIPIAGGTDLMVQKARGFSLSPDFGTSSLLFIADLPELRHIESRSDSLIIGASVTLAELIHHPRIPDIFKEALSLMASPPSRNLATIAGNICNASPAGDTLPYLYAIDAELRLQSSTAERTIPIEDFITGPKQNALQSHELLTEIILPKTNFTHTYYRKIGQRKGMSLTKASFLGMAAIENNYISDLRIAFGSVAPFIIRNRWFEQQLIGKSCADLPAMLPATLENYAVAIKPIDDARSTALYRKKVSLRLLESFLTRLINNDKEK